MLSRRSVNKCGPQRSDYILPDITTVTYFPLNQVDEGRATALLIAARRGCIVVKPLCEHGANVNQEDKKMEIQR